MIPWKLIALLLSWVVVAVAVYEHEQSEFDKERAVAKAAFDAANQHSKEVSDDRERQISQISVELSQTQAKLKASSDTLRSNIASGALRLSVPIASCGAVSNDSSTTSGNHETSAQLDPEFAKSLVGLTERGDKAIIELNSCIDSYNSLLSDK